MPAPFRPSHFIGGLLIEVIFACMLYGLTVLQVFLYFQRHHDDARVLKILVSIVLVLETVHIACCIEFVYFYLIDGFGDFDKLVSVEWGVGASVLCSVLIALCVYSWYIWKIWIMSKKSRIWTCILFILAVARTVFVLGSVTLCFSVRNWVKLEESRLALITVSGSLSSAAIIDTLVALLLTYFLKFRMTHNEFTEKSDNMVNRILLYTVNTGAIISAASIVGVFLFAFEKHSIVFLGMVEIQAKLYANSLLGALNARSHFRSVGCDNGSRYQSTTIQFGASPATMSRADRDASGSESITLNATKGFIGGVIANAA